MARDLEREKLRRANAIIHIPNGGSGRTMCNRIIYDLTKITKSGVYNCVMCEKKHKREKLKNENI